MNSQRRSKQYALLTPVGSKHGVPLESHASPVLGCLSHFQPLLSFPTQLVPTHWVFAVAQSAPSSRVPC